MSISYEYEFCNTINLDINKEPRTTQYGAIFPQHSYLCRGERQLFTFVHTNVIHND